MTRQIRDIRNINVTTFLPTLMRWLAVWLPVLIGVAHQILMFLNITDRIYVFVDPPGYIEPIISVQYQWWIVLTLVTSVLCVLLATRRTSLPHRLFYPLYLYLLYLLIIVKPI